MSLVEGSSGGGAIKFDTVCTIWIKLSNSSISSDKTRLKFYNRADTIVLGKGFLVVNYFDRPVNVTGYDPEDGSKVCLTVTVVLAYDHP